MSRHYHGRIEQEFKASFDTSKLMEVLDGIVEECVASVIKNGCETEAGYFEDYNYVVEGTYDTDYSSTYYEATMESPSESWIEREYLDEVWVRSTNDLFAEKLNEYKLGDLIKLHSIEEDEERAEVKWGEEY